MEQLFTRHPNLSSFRYKSVNDYRTDLINSAAKFNIATGFISSDALVELQRMVQFRHGDLGVNLFIGMNYLDGFTRLQYETLKTVSAFFDETRLGKIYVSPKALFHGKLYSFLDSHNNCLGSFIGSSNLGSFLSTSQNYIESDYYFPASTGGAIACNINNIIRDLGVEFRSAEIITDFKPAETDLLKGNERVLKLDDTAYQQATSNATGIMIQVPLKTEEKSNLNTYFGAGKTPTRYSPRSWYEVEIIISKKTPNITALPDKDDGPFMVITPEKYYFLCERQGDYSKNFRSSGDLRILGRWIKGEMENAGAIKCGEKVTEETLRRFGKRNIVFKRTNYKINGYETWLISLE